MSSLLNTFSQLMSLAKWLDSVNQPDHKIGLEYPERILKNDYPLVICNKSQEVIMLLSQPFYFKIILQQTCHYDLTQNQYE